MARFKGLLRSIVADHSGGVAVLTALSLTALLGVAGLATEASSWYVTKRNMQGAADAAAFSADTALKNGASLTELTAAAKAVAAQYGFVDGTNSVTVTVNNPPQSGSYKNQANAVEVIIAQPQTLLLSSLALSAAPTISTRAVANENGSGGNGPSACTGSCGCVEALDKGNAIDVTDSGNTNVTLNNCSLYVNSDSADALNVSGTASINAYQVDIVGNYQTSGGGSITTTQSGGILTGQSPAADPYANVNIPSYSGCNQTHYSLSGAGTNVTINANGSTPYVFCNGVSLSGNSTLNLGPGTYIIDRGSFSISGNSTIECTACSPTNGTGLTIILTSSTGSGYATVSISGGSNVNLTAPGSGNLAGLAFFQDRNAPSSGTDSFSGGTTQNIYGSIYFPKQNVSFSGGTNTGGSNQCTRLIAYTITFSGNANMANNCPSGWAQIGGGGGNGGSGGGAGTISLVE